MSFYVGQKIVCIDNTLKNGRGEIIVGVRGTHRAVGDLDGLQIGQIYSIRGFGESWETGELGVFLNEIIRPLEPGGPDEIPYRISRFRPLIERKTDISAFQRICDDITNKQPVKV